ncbi:unnamed protein product, partial [Ectocarpus sp. 12 AP-2014]
TLPSSCGFLPRAAAGGKKSQNHPDFGRSSNPSGKREAGWRSGRKITSNVVLPGCSASPAAPAAARDIVQAVEVYR